MNRLISRFALTLLLLCVWSAAHAATSGAPATNGANANTSWYDVELIVFRYTDPQAGDLETWPADPGTPDWKDASPLIVPVAGSTNDALTPLLQIPGHQLDNDWNRLAHSHDYEPLLHVAWTEPLADHATAASIQIGVPPAPPAAESLPGLAPPPAPAATIAPASPVPAPVPTPVYGTAKFSQYGPYLHFDLDLVCQGPIAKHVFQAPAEGTVSGTVAATRTNALQDMDMPAQGAATPQLQWYRMTQDRRIEAGKLNYFDNPMFGVLVLVTPHPLTATH